MFSHDSQGCFHECPKQPMEAACLCLSFEVEIVEGLFHRLFKPLSKLTRIEAQKFPVKNMNGRLSVRHIYFSLIAVGDTYETSPLINEEGAKSIGERARNKDDEDQVDRVRKETSSSL